MKLDETDEKIVKHLLVDARQSARQLALKLLECQLFHTIWNQKIRKREHN